MTKLVRYLWEEKLSILLVLILLVIQAYCDLALPQYTSNIVDIGIQQGGIADIAPDELRKETMENLLLFLTPEETALVNGTYAIQSNGNYRRQATVEQREALDKNLEIPFSALLTAQERNLVEQYHTGEENPQELRQELMDMSKTNQGFQQSLLQQKAITFVRQEYEALGWDMGAYQMQYLVRTGGIMLLYTLGMVLSSVFAGMLGAYMAAKIGRNLRSRVFKKVVAFSSAETDRFSTASLITRNTNDVQQVQMAMVMMTRFVFYAPILGIGGIWKVASSRTGMGWIIGLAVGLVVAVVGLLMSKAMPKFKVMQTLVDRLNLVSREILTGLPVIRAFSRERHEEKRFEDASRDLMQTQLFTNRVMSIMMPAMMLIMNCITGLIVWEGAKSIDLGRLQVGDMMAFITYTMQIIMSFLMITMVSVMLPRAGVAANRIEEVLNMESTIEDAPVVRDGEKEWKGEISFQNVSFRYPGADEDTLEQITFTAHPGETTAIIGSTGCGKSTLIHLIPRFYDVTAGKVTLDGVDVRELSQKKLRSLLGFVPQKAMLFSGNITSNLKFGGDWITDDVMKQAAQIAQAADFIGEKTEGYESHIAQGGTNVSGGQKQRLSIARAIAKQPKIFLFDDSFSALDYKTDVVLRKALKEQIADATVIIVAQRVSTILNANQIIVLEEGKVAGIGTHQQLMRDCAAYQEIARSQLSEKELGGGAV